MLMIDRLRALLPARWLAGERTDALLGGIADALQVAADFLGYAVQQTRLATVSGIWLDLAAADFTGTEIVRRTGELDDAFRARLRREILRERVTRVAMSAAITDMTGHVPAIIEPWNPSDTAAWTGPTAFWGIATIGSQAIGAQAFVSPIIGGGVADVSGWNCGATAWSLGSGAQIDAAIINAGVSIDDVLAQINRTRPTGVTVWAPLTI